MLLGGRDVRSIPTAELMEQISFVFQEVRLFKKSIRDNIRAARPDATEAEILHAAQLAQCGDILEKTPGGLDAVIGAKGVYLSGGEMQRIALARAILKDAPIVVLDEASSFADPENCLLYTSRHIVDDGFTHCRKVSSCDHVMKLTSHAPGEHTVFSEEGVVFFGSIDLQLYQHLDEIRIARSLRPAED